jgi:D-3-phosphoglycerate dehydrogenase / 2-oxoglutarate reductase
MKICYLNPPSADLSVEVRALAGTSIDLVPCRTSTEDDVIRLAKEADAVITVYAPITARVVKELERSQVIVRLGVGYDVVDVPSCQKRGIIVCNVPDYGTEEVANHALALCFALHRRILAYDRNVRKKDWNYGSAGPIHRLSTLRAGILGLGRIGTAFANGIKPFVRDVVAFDPFLTADEFQAKGIVSVTLEELFQTGDIISLHLPLSKENHHLISNAAIGQMKRRPILINVSRGGLVDSAALAKALASGQISGAGIDVFEDEPNVPEEYFGLDNIVFTPHVAWYSEESNLQLRRSAIEEIVRVLTGHPPLHPVTTQ